MVEDGRRGARPPTYPGAKALREVVKDPLALTARIAARDAMVANARRASSVAKHLPFGLGPRHCKTGVTVAGTEQRP
jgi:hypothetical protein